MLFWTRRKILIPINNLENNISYQIVKLVEDYSVTYTEATLFYYDAYSEIDDINKFAEKLDKTIIKEIEKEAYESGKLKNITTESIDTFLNFD